MACEICSGSGKNKYEYDTVTNQIFYNFGGGSPSCDPANIQYNYMCSPVANWNSEGGCPGLCSGAGCTYLSTDATGNVLCYGDSSCMGGCSGINELSGPKKVFLGGQTSNFWVSTSWILGAFIVLLVFYRYKFRKPSA